MTIYKINPDLLKPEGASDGDVITYVSANSRVEWAAPTGGGGDVANVWVNANDYATYTSITSNLNSVNSNVDSIAANLYNTYTTLSANDYNSFTTLTANIYNTLLAAQSNDVATLLSAQANDYNNYTTLTANDYNSFTTLTANIYNTFAYLNANVGGGGGDVANAWVNANDYNTYTTLYSLIDTVQDNVAAIGSSDIISDQFTVTTSNIFTLSQAVSSANNILVSLNGILQKPSDDYIVASTTLTIANVEPLSSGIAVEVRYLTAGSGGGGGSSGITTGKAIAMAMIFGG